MSKKLIVIMAALLALTGIIAAVHLSQQEEISCMVIKTAEEELQIDFTDLDQSDFAGQLTDGKGDTLEHTYRGILLRELLEQKGVTLTEEMSVTVTSADNYSVTFAGTEVLADGRVYAAIEADGEAIEGIDPGTAGVQIIVFGDENSRRCVRFAAVIEIG